MNPLTKKLLGAMAIGSALTIPYAASAANAFDGLYKGSYKIEGSSRQCPNNQQGPAPDFTISNGHVTISIPPITFSNESVGGTYTGDVTMFGIIALQNQAGGTLRGQASETGLNLGKSTSYGTCGITFTYQKR